jgi:hypothetical protein
MAEDRASEAGERRRELDVRTAELRELRARLDAGEAVTADDLELAGRRLSEATDRAIEAQQRSARAHRRAAEAHRSAAQVADRAGHPDSAEGHRRAAGDDDDAAFADEKRVGSEP